MMRVSKKILLLSVIGISLFLQGFTFTTLELPFSGKNPRLANAYDDLPIVQPFEFTGLDDATQANIRVKEEQAFRAFVNTVSDGNANMVRGLYVQNKFEFPVVQQPTGDTGFVSNDSGVVTDFAMADKYGVTGLIAHNYLAGADFFTLQIGDVLDVVYGDGTIKAYRVAEIRRYQALSPNSASSNFVDLSTNENMTASQLFKRVYMGAPHLTLQTCIQQGSEDSWGRLFVIADPVQ